MLFDDQPGPDILCIVDVQNDFCPSMYSTAILPENAFKAQQADPRKVYLSVSKDKKLIKYKLINQDGKEQTGTLPGTDAIWASKNPEAALDKHCLDILASRGYIYYSHGTLAVPEGDKVVPVINDLMDEFPEIVATQDWHPQDHTSFQSNHPEHALFSVIKLPNGSEQCLWPDHCVQGSRGAEFHPDLHTQKITKVIQKGKDPNVDSYSGLYDNDHKNPTELVAHLAAKKPRAIYVTGLATDYCVAATAIDMKNAGHPVYLVEDACRGVNLNKSDVANAIKNMHDAGVVVVQSSWVRHIKSGKLSPTTINQYHNSFVEFARYVEELQEKSKKNKAYRTIAPAAKQLLDDLKTAREQFFTQSTNLAQFQENCQQLVEKAKPLFAEHRGWGKWHPAFIKQKFAFSAQPSENLPQTNSIGKLEAFGKAVYGDFAPLQRSATFRKSV